MPGLSLARQRTVRKDAARTQSKVEMESWQGVDRELFDRLRALRLEVARSRGVPPYVIFHDATLREMARLRPASLDALLEVRGVGARKAEDLGGVFLEAIRAHMRAEGRTVGAALNAGRGSFRRREPAFPDRSLASTRLSGGRALARAPWAGLLFRFLVGCFHIN